MGKINTDNYPNRPFASYQDDDMFILQDNGGETYTTNIGDIKDLIGEETDPKLALKVDKNGTDRLMTADEGTKLAGIAAGAQVNVLEGVVVDSIVQPISGKKAFIDLSDKTDLSVIAYTFNSEMGYFKGAYVTYNGKLYEFIQEHTGAWNPSHVREIKASGQYVRTGNGGYNNGDRATCEGYMTKASGNYSHAEGRETQAVGECTHAEGRETIANGIYQHVEGKYNIADNESKYIHIIGNGIDDNNRSNAMTLDWDGNLEVSGEVEDGNGEKLSDKADKVTNATSGHLAGLDANGNLTDSGVSPTEDVTVEGNPVTFDSPFEQDAKSVVVSVKPIQDLHGYDHPWVGGAGKNQWDENVKNGYWDTNDGVYHYGANELCTKDLIPVTPETTYYGFNGSGTSLKEILYYDVNGDYISYNVESSWQNKTFTTPANCYFIAFNFGPNYGTTYNNDIAINYPATISTYSPYSNICPISGIDEVEIEVSGKNLFDKSKVVQGSKTEPSSGTRCCTRGFFGLYLNAGTVITYSSNSYDVYCSLEIIDKDYNSYQDSGWITQSTTITITASGYAFFGFRKANNSNVQPSDIQALNIQLELGSTPSDYEPYNPNSHTTTILLPSTLYGGDVDVTNGDADDNNGFVEFDGSADENWQMEGAPTAASGSKRFILLNVINYPTLPSSYYPLNVITNGLSLASGDATWGGSADNALSISLSGTDINIRVAGIDTVEGLKTWLSNNPVQVCYELATPTTISFTPADVELLEGTNVVTTNGEKVAVTYGRSLWQDIGDLKTNTEGKLDKSDVADVEGDTASRAYSVNEFMLRADGFYKVTQPIASGASITASNTTKTTVGEVLTALLNA